MSNSEVLWGFTSVTGSETDPNELALGTALVHNANDSEHSSKLLNSNEDRDSRIVQ